MHVHVCVLSNFIIIIIIISFSLSLSLSVVQFWCWQDGGFHSIVYCTGEIYS